MTLQEATGTWGDETFPHSTARSVMDHLKDEIGELDVEVDAYLAERSPEGRAALAEEAADCYLLLLHIAHKYGFDLEVAATAKLARNRVRTWGEPDARGVVRHVE